MSDQQTRRYGMTMFIMMWVIIIVGLAYVFGRWMDHANNPNQDLHSVTTESGTKEVTLQRNRYGHYVMTGFINEMPVTFMVDTGATDVSVPEQLMKELGLQRGDAITLSTANGLAQGYATRINKIQVGEITMRDVKATINPNVDHHEILLGMSFLKHIEFTQRGDTLILRQGQPQQTR